MKVHELIEELMKIPNQELDVWSTDHEWGEEPLSDDCVTVGRTLFGNECVVFIDDFVHEEVDYDE